MLTACTFPSREYPSITHPREPLISIYGRKIVTASQTAAGFYGQGSADSSVYDLLIVPIDAQGNEDRTQAISIQR